MPVLEPAPGRISWNNDVPLTSRRHRSIDFCWQENVRRFCSLIASFLPHVEKIDETFAILIGCLHHYRVVFNHAKLTLTLPHVSKYRSKPAPWWYHWDKLVRNVLIMCITEIRCFFLFFWEGGGYRRISHILYFFYYFNCFSPNSMLCWLLHIVVLCPHAHCG